MIVVRGDSLGLVFDGKIEAVMKVEENVRDEAGGDHPGVQRSRVGRQRHPERARDVAEEVVVDASSQ